jgi:hypothetical protein
VALVSFDASTLLKLVVGHPDLVVAVWDRCLAAAALAAGLAVTPPPG